MATGVIHTKRYAVVIVPAALPQNYTWAVPAAHQEHLMPGHRVLVNLGKSKKYVGVVKSISEESPPGRQVKEIVKLLDDAPFVSAVTLRLWEWIAGYYLCSEGEVMAAALPAPFRTMDGDAGAAFQPKMERFVTLDASYAAEERLAKLLSTWKGAPRQLAVLLAFLELQQRRESVLLSALLNRSGATTAQVNALVEKGIIVLCKKPVDRIEHMPVIHTLDFALTSAQQEAFRQIKASWKKQSVCLLHGVTASGKTQVYIQLISEALQRGEQVLYLLPEIALTAQIVRRLQHCFGGQVGVYHSKFSQQERAELWQKIASGQLTVLLGARSSVFLPFKKLGLIICDEEHDPSFKQQEPSPRYHGRDAAIYLSTLVKANVLLG
ncbi:MAG: DEAD/DEAH box helicase, partial [Sphingomonadales bacterium]